MDELHLLASSSSSPHIIALTETWLDPSIKECEVHLPSYTLLRHDRDRHGGGVAIYYHDSISIHSSFNHQNYELLSIVLDTKSGTVLLCVIYRPPSFDCDLSILESVIGSLQPARYGKVVIVGDFNADL